MSQRIWFERSFAVGTPLDAYPELIERLRGTPARIEERMGTIDAEALTRRNGERWSIQEHVGHLSDLEPLWLGRVDDLVNGANELRPADLENTATWQADHNAVSCNALLAEFRRRRAALVARLEGLDERQRSATSLHPRLRQPMTTADLSFFVAEHDDHHLATVSKILRTRA